MNHAIQGRRSFGRGALGVLALLAIVQLVALSGCNSGKRNAAQPGTGPAVDPAQCASGAAFLLSASTNTGCVGQDIILEGLNFSPTLGDNIVLFSDTTGEFSIEGLVTEFIDQGIHPVFQCPAASLVVKVPSGARTGFINLQVRTADGTLLDAGLVSFSGCPEITSFAVGIAGNPFLAVDAGFTLLNTEVQLFGYNLGTVTDVVLTDPQGQNVTGSTVSVGGVTNPDYTVPAGVEVITVTLDPPAPIVPTCQTYYLRMSLTDASGGAPVSSNSVIIPVREQFAPNEFAELPGTITGVLLPSGVRRGMVPLNFNLCMDPAQARYDVIPEFQNPITGDWFECTGATPEEGELLIPGVVGHQGAFGGIIGGGQSYTFMWDTVADGLVYDPSANGTPLATRVRYRIEDIFPGSVQVCDTSSQNNVHFETGLFLIDNPIDVTSAPPMLLGLEGSIEESFNDNLKEETGNTALWNDGDSGLLSGGAPTGAPWGDGTTDIVCGDFSEFSLGFLGVYLFDTDTVTITDISDDTSPVNLHAPAAGDPAGVFVLRSLVIEENATIQVVGSNPLRFQISGDGTVDFLACQILGDINLNGEAGGAAAGDVPGDGGLGGPGGGAGGVGGSVDAQTGGGGIVFGDFPAGRGENNGGYPGDNMTFVRIGASSSAKAGPGGGAGGLTSGMSGDSDWPSQFERGRPGKGGPVRGDVTLVNPVPGAGGGGGGGMVFRQNSTADIVLQAGGGGGGGGGCFEAIVNGSVFFGGTITVNGGDGGQAGSLHAGPGGGGSGGSVRMSASGDISIAEAGSISALGGAGFTTNNQFAGDGAPGRVRLEAGGTVNFPSVGDFSLLEPPLGGALSVSVGKAAQGAINGGTGADGPLDISQFGPGIYVVDTDAGEIRGPIVAPAEESEAAYLAAAAAAGVVRTRSGAVDWEFTNLTISSGATLRAVGSLPLVIRVSGECTIDGNGVDPSIDVSGFDGFTPDVTTDPTAPTPGAGGAGGPGGGDGGMGGFANSDTDFAAGADGALDHLPPHLVAGPPLGGGSGGDPFPAQGAEPAEGGSADLTPGGTSPAGSGGGGAFAGPGANASDPLGGAGGTAYGSSFFFDPIGSGRLTVGGAGGAGGGGNIDAFPTEPYDHAPGSGAGGGAGFLQVAVTGTLNVTEGAVLLARGGNAYRAPTNGGNGGGGAGGGVLVQCEGIASFEGLVDVSGGQANLDPPAGVPYVANIEMNAGDGSQGRIRIETTLGFVDESELQVTPAPSVGVFRGATGDRSVAASLPYLLAVDGAVRVGGAPNFVAPAISLQPPVAAGADFVLVYEGAKESVDQPGRPGEFEGHVSDPAQLDNPDYIRLIWYMYTNRTTSQSVFVDSYELQFSY